MTILPAGIDLAKNEPPRLSWRPVGVSQTGERSGEFGRLFGCSVFPSSSPPQGPPEAPRLGHVLMVQPSCSAADWASLVVVGA